LRKNNVPRYLFRCWSSHSGGGRSVSINSAKLIMPAGFLAKTMKHDMYTMGESEVIDMIRDHYFGRDTLSGFSSWTASLSLVMLYADYKTKSNPWEKHVHVSVIDTRELGDEVLVWHVPHLARHLDCRIAEETAVHEYLAYGVISGKGYMAVPFEKIMEKGLVDIYPEISGTRRNWSGWELRKAMFKEEARSMTQQEVEVARTIAKLFGARFVLVISVALVSIRPRPW
ncbi:hypothetical protein K458DRAFT_240527, partial [Lentithecium fluviatile CBS 122367]